MHHVAKAEKFELRRSSRAEVSKTIAAVDDDLPLFVECMPRVVQQLRQRQMNRASNRRSPMLVGRQHVHHLPARGDDFQNIRVIDHSHSRILLSRGRYVSQFGKCDIGN
jgi:hypothetical protein